MRFTLLVRHVYFQIKLPTVGLYINVFSAEHLNTQSVRSILQWQTNSSFTILQQLNRTARLPGPIARNTDISPKTFTLTISPWTFSLNVSLTFPWIFPLNIPLDMPMNISLWHFPLDISPLTSPWHYFGYSPKHSPWTFPLDIPTNISLWHFPPGHFTWTFPLERLLDIPLDIPINIPPGHSFWTFPWTFPFDIFPWTFSHGHFPLDIPPTSPLNISLDIPSGYSPSTLPLYVKKNLVICYQFMVRVSAQGLVSRLGLEIGLSYFHLKVAP